MKITLFTLFLLGFAVQISPAQSLRVMTYNIRLDVASDGENSWSKRKEYLVSQVRFYEPDVWGVQEALPNQMDDLSKLMPEYSHIGTGRDAGGTGEASAVFFKRNRFRVTNESTFWLSETPDKVSKGWDAALPRICTYGLFRDLKTKRHFWFFNTHLDHIGETARSKGIELILSKIAEVNKKNYPAIFTGDLNSEPNTERIINLKRIMLDTQEAAAQKAFGPSGTFNGFRFNEPVKRLIDYIFIDRSRRFTVKKHAILSDSKDLRYPSDHFPVFAELEFSR